MNTKRKVSQIVVEDHEIVSVQFSNHSLLLKVISYNGKPEAPVSKVMIWDFLDGQREYLAQSVLPMKIIDAKWNPYIKEKSDEFVTISDFKYHYWRLTPTL